MRNSFRARHRCFFQVVLLVSLINYLSMLLSKERLGVKSVEGFVVQYFLSQVKKNTGGMALLCIYMYV